MIENLLAGVTVQWTTSSNIIILSGQGSSSVRVSVITYLPVALLILSVIATCVPLSGEEVADKLPILALTIVLLAAGVSLMVVLNRQGPRPGDTAE